MKTYAIYFGKHDSALMELDSVERVSWDIGNRRIYTFDAADWNEASTIYNEFMGYEPYIPLDQRQRT